MYNKRIPVKLIGDPVARIVRVARTAPDLPATPRKFSEYVIDSGSEIKVLTQVLNGKCVRVTCERITVLASLNM